MHSEKDKTKNQAHWREMAGMGCFWRGAHPDDLLIGIDDTDNLDSPGTGFRAREIARFIGLQGWGQPQGITRHQLLVHPDVPYTSHNSSACICVIEVTNASAIRQFCRDYLIEFSAPGSDTGLCITRRQDVLPPLVAWGRAAKTQVLHLGDATALANRHGMYLEGFTGTHGGMIGALAGVGLHTEGADGRFLWCRGVREAAGARLSVRQLSDEMHLKVLALQSAEAPQPNDVVDLGDWPRAIFHHHHPTLLLEPHHENLDVQWRVIAKERLKQY